VAAKHFRDRVFEALWRDWAARRPHPVLLTEIPIRRSNGTDGKIVHRHSLN